MQRSNHRFCYRIVMSLVVVPVGSGSVQVGETTINPRAVHDPVREGEEAGRDLPLGE